ncbi:lipoprotein [Prescottella defluvii]|uniref:YncE family protein n=1 Tax=Prescottella defluvii TaxID=1323361 RepID=UPI0004F3B021|nr:lipoprotein [Prescottella defluvii]
MRVPAPRITACTIGAAALLLLTGCSSEQNGDNLKTIEPATAAVSPAGATPAGSVQDIGRAVDALLFDATTKTTTVLTDGGTRLLLQTEGTEPREITLDGTAAQITLASDGRVLAPMDGRVQIVDIASGEAASTAVDGDARSAAFLPDGRLAVGLSSGRVQVIAGTGGTTETISGLASVDALAVTGEDLSALDRRQTSLTQIDLEDAELGLALRAGEGATQLITDRHGRILVTDTTGNELLVFTTDPLIMRQRYPVANAPYAIAYDDRTDLVWVTLTASNKVVGYDLSTGIPVEKARYDTVRQPNSVAVDTVGGNLVVGSAAGDGLQWIPLAAG